jgi:predicted transcriptional regulator
MSTKVLLSIKPRFAEKILSGEKRYEFRRAIFKRPRVRVIVVYASAPVQKVVGEFTISEILYDEVDSLWRRTRKYSGITEDVFYRYFENKDRGYALGIRRVKRYRIPFCPRKHFGVFPPQSYAYL